MNGESERVARLHLVDATFELFRAYFAMPSEKSPDGTEVGAVRGLLSSMLALLREPDVTHIGAATDHTIESFRNDMFAGYKTGEGLEPELWAQFPIAEEALRCLGIVVWPMEEFEADDALASAAHHFADQVDEIIILSPDKDMAQCVRGDRIVTFDRIRKKRYDEEAVIAKFGVRPGSIPDYLALTGDTADGIPGLAGWGAKSSATVLYEYESIENIPNDAAEWNVKVRSANRLAATLQDQREDAALYKRLATLRSDANVTKRLEELHWRGVPKKSYLALCDRLGFASLRDRPHHWAPTT